MASARWRARLGSRLGVQSSRRAVLLTRRGLSHDSEAAGQLLSIPLPTSKSRAAEELQPPRCELAMSSEMKRLCTLRRIICVCKYPCNSAAPIRTRSRGDLRA